jgi:hypothetical protein
MSVEQYRARLRSAAYGFWRGAGDYDWFFYQMIIVTEMGLTRAWNEGAEECGITPEEMTFKEKMILSGLIHEEQSHIGGFASFIEQNSKAMGGKRGTIYNRVELWVNRYNAVKNKAKATTCADKKLRWTLNVLRISKEHCESCLKLAGKVKRASQWAASGWEPQGRMLACGGWRCACALVPTDEPMSKGPLPRLP